MKTKLDELIEWMNSLEYPSDIPSNSHLTYARHTRDLVLMKARELRDTEQKEPPYDREAFRRELIVGLAGNGSLYTSISNNIEWINNQADAIIAEYERRQNEQR